MRLWCYEKFLNMLPPGRIPLVPLIQISLKSLMGKGKGRAYERCLLFPFHSVSIPSPQSLWIMTESLSLCWGAVGWRELFYPVELLKRLSWTVELGLSQRPAAARTPHNTHDSLLPECWLDRPDGTNFKALFILCLPWLSAVYSSFCFPSHYSERRDSHIEETA